MLTGRCKNIPKAKTQTVCKVGYYRNPLTGRCKKNETKAAAKICPAGYELNTATNRCRKKRATGTSKYPVDDYSETSYDNPQIFIAVWAFVALGAVVFAYVIFQFRHEIVKLFQRTLHRRAHDKL